MADDERPAFTAPLWAAIRQGGKELEQILPAFPDSVQPVSEPGTLGNPTSQIVTEQMGNFHGYGLDAHLQNAALDVGMDQGRQMEMGG